MDDGLFYHDVFRALASVGARYVVVGGVAVNLRGVPRFTADLDLLVAMDAANLTAIAGALTALGLRPRLPVSVEQFADPAVVRDWVENRNMVAFTLQHPDNPLRQVDLLFSSPVSYEEAAETADVLRARDIELPVAASSTLVRMKSATGREQDAADVDALLRLQGLGDG